MTEQELMLTSLLDCERINLYVDRKPLGASDQNRFEQMRKRREQGEPLQYILGCCEFFGMKFFVDNRVLVPRPETELLVEEVLKRMDKQKSLNILDLGTGSGNIAISLAKFLPRSQVTAVDVSWDALKLSKDNARFHALDDKINFVHQDMAVYLQGQEEKLFDIIVSNPPYIARSKLNSLPKDVQQEPKIALDGGEDGLDFYKIIIAHAGRFLKDGGFLFLEIGDGQRAAVEQIFRDHPICQNVEFFKDYSGGDRVAVCHCERTLVSEARLPIGRQSLKSLNE